MTVNHPKAPPTLAGSRRLLLACVAEGGLIFLAVGLAWLLEEPLAAAINPPGRQVQAVAIGLAATLPMVGFLVVLMRTTWRPAAVFRGQVRSLLGPLLEGAGWGPILAIAVLAGVGEELLFRGVLQPAAIRWLDPVVAPVARPAAASILGLLAVSLLFGLAHPMSRAYIVVATIGGLYLGLLPMLTGEVLSATVAHAAYDVVALVWFRTQSPASAPQQ